MGRLANHLQTVAASRLVRAAGATEFSIITTAPSTIMPKSIAPRLIRFAETPNTRHADEAEQQRDAESPQRRCSARPNVAQEQKQHRDDQQSGLEQVARHGPDRSVDHVGLVVERHDR